MSTVPPAESFLIGFLRRGRLGVSRRLTHASKHARARTHTHTHTHPYQRPSPLHIKHHHPSISNTIIPPYQRSSNTIIPPYHPSISPLHITGHQAPPHHPSTSPPAITGHHPSISPHHHPSISPPAIHHPSTSPAITPPHHPSISPPAYLKVNFLLALPRMTLAAAGWVLEFDSAAAAAAGASVDAVDASCCRDDAEEGFGMAVEFIWIWANGNCRRKFAA